MNSPEFDALREQVLHRTVRLIRIHRLRPGGFITVGRAVVSHFDEGIVIEINNRTLYERFDRSLVTSLTGDRGLIAYAMPLYQEALKELEAYMVLDDLSRI